jgi:hypothetical protein
VAGVSLLEDEHAQQREPAVDRRRRTGGLLAGLIDPADGRGVAAADGHSKANGHENGQATEGARRLDEAQSRLPRPRPPEEIPDWTEPTDKETPSEVDR